MPDSTEPLSEMLEHLPKYVHRWTPEHGHERAYLVLSTDVFGGWQAAYHSWRDDRTYAVFTPFIQDAATLKEAVAQLSELMV